MDQESNEATATERARWLAELAAVIEQAQKLVWRLGVTEGNNPEAVDLYARLELARDEVEALRRGDWAGERHAIDPFWMESFGWPSHALDKSD